MNLLVYLAAVYSDFDPKAVSQSGLAGL